MDLVVNIGTGWDHFLLMLEQIAEQHPGLASDARNALDGKALT